MCQEHLFARTARSAQQVWTGCVILAQRDRDPAATTQLANRAHLVGSAATAQSVECAIREKVCTLHRTTQGVTNVQLDLSAWREFVFAAKMDRSRTRGIQHVSRVHWDSPA